MYRSQRVLIGAAGALLVLVGCGGAAASTLSEDDQQACTDQEDELAYARQAIDEIIHGDRHWGSEGEAWSIDEVAITPALNFLSSVRPQDEDLVSYIQGAQDALFQVTLDLGQDDDAFANNAESSRNAAAAMEDLQKFCDDNA